jgi:hypothetical protein
MFPKTPKFNEGKIWGGNLMKAKFGGGKIVGKIFKYLKFNDLTRYQILTVKTGLFPRRSLGLNALTAIDGQQS